MILHKYNCIFIFVPAKPIAEPYISNLSYPKEKKKK